MTYTKEDFWKDFDDQIIIFTLNYGFFINFFIHWK
jgi:hypothetical protein